MIQRYINNSIYNVDNFFKQDRWLFKLKVNDYQVVTIAWNIMLVFVPWVAATALRKLYLRTGLRRPINKLLALVIFFVWLLFIPNTAYIISEVRHLLDYCPRNAQFQVCEKNAWMSIFFFTYSAIGWIFFVYLLSQMESLLRMMYGKVFSRVFSFIMIPLISLGFLLGLVNRWNSWEFFIYPKQFFSTIPVYWTDPIYFTNWLIFTIFLYILYWGGQWLFKERF